MANHAGSANQQIPDGAPHLPQGNASDQAHNGLGHSNNHGSAVILSFDGGGIRGYSSLLIVEKLMDYCAQFEREENTRLGLQQTSSDPDPLELDLPLPCHYFDYIVGTSTGGLIAIMFGRLRMNVRDCLRVYRDLGRRVFGWKRYHKWTRYSSETLEAILKGVVETHCSDVGSAKEGEDYMYQKDPIRNSCRTIVYAAQRRKKEKETTHAFRSYLPSGTDDEIDQYANPQNPRQVFIYQAALATSAAPHFFKVATVNGDEFVDGGITVNNPTNEAWNEAYRMRLRRNIPQHVNASGPPVGHVVSIGTGLKDGQSILVEGNIFSKVLSVIKWAIRHMTDTEENHRIVRNKANQQQPKVPYHRFNVKTGLESIELDHCKKKDRTFQEMETATQSYLRSAETVPHIRHCARLLVERRRGRCTAEELRRPRLHNLTAPGPRRVVMTDLYPTGTPSPPPSQPSTVSV